MRNIFAIVCFALLPFVAGCGSSDSATVMNGGEIPPDTGREVDKRLAGGDTTVFTETSSAFETPAPNLVGDQLDRHMAGDVAFEDVFVTAPAPVNSGLGPIFNHSACINCHPRDGRGRSAAPGEPFEAIFLRISAGNDAITGPIPVQGYGLQLQHRAVVGVTPEVQFDVSYEDVPVNFADGESVTLRRPTFTVNDAYEVLPDNVFFGARVAPPVFGRGLLEAIPEATIEALADEMDSDGDGISGRPNRVRDPISGQTLLGRFGSKATAPSLIVQNAGAYSQDMGVTNPVFPIESAFAQIQDDGLLDDVEVDDETLELVTFFIQTLGVPARRRMDDPMVVQGETLFDNAKCSGCHIPQLETSDFPVTEVANQTIFPYTDMLLHDMGDDLADGREDFLASGSEWRTPPLWGIGLSATVNGHTDFLHDGRARNLTEAILWHGGEAVESREAFINLTGEERQALLAFLNSL